MLCMHIKDHLLLSTYYTCIHCMHTLYIYTLTHYAYTLHIYSIVIPIHCVLIYKYSIHLRPNLREPCQYRGHG